MKSISTFIVFCLFIIDSRAQKNDAVWAIGYGFIPNNWASGNGGIQMIFQAGDVEIDTFSINCSTNFSMASVSDSIGNFLLYTDGCKVYQINGSAVKSSDSLNFPSMGYDLSCASGQSGYAGTIFGTQILPIPDSDSLFALLHLKTFEKEERAIGYLLLSQIDMRKRGGEGEVILKNKPLLADSLVDMIAATRHGNGRDWWICASSNRTGDLQLFQLGPNGEIDGPFEQKLKHNKWDKSYLGFRTQGVFSPDGSLFARFAPLEGLHVYEFNRCSGEFSTPRVVLWKTTVSDSGKVTYFDFLGDKKLWAPPCVAFSPNGRFLYATTGQRCFQFDIKKPDLLGSVQLVGEFVHNPNESVFQTTIFMPQLAPDGKIYISCTNGTKFLHVIEKPNEKGDDCLFRYRGVPLPVYHGFCLPAHPNYRLHEWAHSPCDSLTYYPPIPVDSCLGQNALLFAPNPANDVVKIQITPCKTGDLRVWNVLGQLLFEQEELATESGKLELIVRDWPSGSYFIEFFQPEKAGRLTRKLVVARKD